MCDVTCRDVVVVDVMSIETFIDRSRRERGHVTLDCCIRSLHCAKQLTPIELNFSHKYNLMEAAKFFTEFT